MSYLSNYAIYRNSSPKKSSLRRTGFRSGRLSVAEVARAGGDHRGPGNVCGGDDLLVADRAARLDDPRDPGLDGELGTVGEREVGVGGEAEPASRSGWKVCAFSIAMRTASTLLIWPAPMPIVARPRAMTIALERT